MEYVKIDHSVKAKELFKQGYNCAQAVLLAFADELDIDNDTALKLSSSFGGGMGRLREVCGAVSGMFMVVGLKYGSVNPSDAKAKAEHYKLIQELAAHFTEVNHSIICRDLLGLNIKIDNPVPETRCEQYYKKRPCVELVCDAAKILDSYIEERAAIALDS